VGAARGLAFGSALGAGGAGAGAGAALAFGSLTLLGAPFGLPLVFGVSGGAGSGSGSGSGAGSGSVADASSPTRSQMTSIFIFRNIIVTVGYYFVLFCIIFVLFLYYFRICSGFFNQEK
jgi:hypothetical protein